MTNTITIEQNLRSLSIDGGEPIAIPSDINSLPQFVDWLAEHENVNSLHVLQAITILKRWITNKRSFSELRSRK